MKGSEQMSEKRKEALARLAEIVSQLDKDNFNYRGNELAERP